MRVQVWYEGEFFFLQCGNGNQRLSWVARVAAQRFAAGGLWCSTDKEVGRPKEYVPGRIFSYPENEILDEELTIVKLAENLEHPDDDLSFTVELLNKPQSNIPPLAAAGSEDSVIPPKNAKTAMSYRVTRNSSGLVVKRTPPPAPSPHRGFDFSVIYATIDVSDISSGADFMELAALRNVISNNFHPLVDIFYHYARPRHPSHQESSAAAAAAANASSSGTSPTAAAILALPQEYLHHSVTMRGLSELVRACRLSDPTCSFFEIQRRSLRPNPHEGLDDSLFPSQPDDYPVPVFFEAIIRIANLKHYGLHSLCDRVSGLYWQR